MVRWAQQDVPDREWQAYLKLADATDAYDKALSIVLAYERQCAVASALRRAAEEMKKCADSVGWENGEYDRGVTAGYSGAEDWLHTEASRAERGE